MRRTIFKSKIIDQVKPNSSWYYLQLDLSPIKIPYSIQYLYRYMKPLFFWGDDVIAILQKTSDL
jgi:hypothetical protein